MSSAVHSAATRDAVLGLRTARARSRRTPSLAPLLAVGLGFLLHLAAPVPLPADETLAPPLLERTFALLFLVAAVLGFSTVERLFRRDSLPVLVRYPVDARWVTRERATRIARDTGLLVALVGCALLPEFFVRGLVPEVFATASFLALAVPVLFGATFGGAMLAIGTGPAPGTSPTARARSFDLAAPAALAASSLLLLILELGVAEPLRSLRDTGAVRVQRSAWLAVGLSLIGALALARRGIHAYRNRFFQLGALFEEAERYTPPIASDRFESEYQRASRWDRGLDPVETGQQQAILGHQVGHGGAKTARMQRMVGRGNGHRFAALNHHPLVC